MRTLRTAVRADRVRQDLDARGRERRVATTSPAGRPARRARASCRRATRTRRAHVRRGRAPARARARSATPRPARGTSPRGTPPVAVARPRRTDQAVRRDARGLRCRRLRLRRRIARSRAIDPKPVGRERDGARLLVVELEPRFGGVGAVALEPALDQPRADASGRRQIFDERPPIGVGFGGRGRTRPHGCSRVRGQLAQHRVDKPGRAAKARASAPARRCR